MTRRRRRLTILLLCALGLGTATALTLTAFQDNLVFFQSPSDIATNPPPPARAFRLGGLVEQGSVTRDTTPEGRPRIAFRVTDGQHTVAVQYAGVLPDLFREGQGVVTLGQMGPGRVFLAREVLARHDENYMPPEVAEALRRTGHWNPATGAPPPPGGRSGTSDAAPPPGGRPGTSDAAPPPGGRPGTSDAAPPRGGRS